MQNRDESYVGDIIDVEKGSHIALMIKNQSLEIKIGTSLRINTPDGKVKLIRVESMKNAMAKDIVSASHGDIVFLKPVSGVSIRSMAFTDN